MSVLAGSFTWPCFGVCFLEVVTCLEGKDLSFKTLSQVKKEMSQPVLCFWGGCKKEHLVLRKKNGHSLFYQVLEL